LLSLSSLVVERDPGYWSNAHPPICEREHPYAAALCGAEPFSTMWTNDRRSYVTCRACLKEIEPGCRRASRMRQGRRRWPERYFLMKRSSSSRQ
jgi:hypothetical protein